MSKTQILRLAGKAQRRGVKSVQDGNYVSGRRQLEAAKRLYAFAQQAQA